MALPLRKTNTIRTNREEEDGNDGDNNNNSNKDGAPKTPGQGKEANSPAKEAKVNPHISGITNGVTP